MTILWFILGLLIIIGIARYNESDALFWKLLVSFVGTYGACVLISNYIENNKNKETVEVVSTTPTQGRMVAKPIIFGTVPSEVKCDCNPNPVSKDSVVQKTDSTLSKISGNNNRDQPGYFDTS